MAAFVPLAEARTSLLTLDSEPTAPRPPADLPALPDYKLVLVRGFSFGPAHDNAVATLSQRQRLPEESDIVSVARVLRRGLANGTIMVGALVSEPEWAPLLDCAKTWLHCRSSHVPVCSSSPSSPLSHLHQ